MSLGEASGAVIVLSATLLGCWINWRSEIVAAIDKAIRKRKARADKLKRLSKSCHGKDKSEAWYK